jgi:gliding motility-associated protein GldE
MDYPPEIITEAPVILSAGFGHSDYFINYFIILILIAASALVSAAEVAFFSLTPSDKERFKTENSRAGNVGLSLLAKPKDLLAILLIVTNFLNVCIIIISTGIIDSYFTGTSGNNQLLRFVVEIVGITAFLLLFGEVTPKLFATKNAYATVRLMANPINIINKIPPFSWLRWLLVNGTNIVNQRARKRNIKLSTDDLEHALALTIEDSSNENEQRILEGIVKFGNTDVKQIMKPRVDVISINADKSFQEVLDIILEAGYSRIPVYENAQDNIIGILYIKDLLPYINQTEFEWKTLLRKPFFIPDNKKIDDLLKTFQNMKMHMAIVVDEYGAADGLVTLEDVLEEIVGDITDEFDEDDLVYTKIDDSTYLFEGKTALVDFYKVLDIDGKDFESIKGESDTVGGFIVEQAGRILKNNEYITCGKVKLIVESSDKRRVKLIKTIVEND